MNRDLALRVLGETMGWDDDKAREEYRWLRFISSLKYDSYRDFQAGMRFTESLATWLQQFDLNDRELAYSFVRDRLVFIGLSESHHLVEQFYPAVVHKRIVANIASRYSIMPYEVQLDSRFDAEVAALRRKTLFLGLSDGARMDVLRHANVGRLTNEQMVAASQLDEKKWTDLAEDLRKDVKDDDARFEIVYLVDDFTATGTSFIRLDEESGKWKGKLSRFAASLEPFRDNVVAQDWDLCIHHLVASTKAVDHLTLSVEASTPQFSSIDWSRVFPTYGMTLRPEFPLSVANAADAQFMAMAERYYDSRIETKHTRIGGVDRIVLGYGGCALPLVLEHNTPNNSVALLWADTYSRANDSGEHPMRPLFRRRQRHVD